LTKRAVAFTARPNPGERSHDMGADSWSRPPDGSRGRPSPPAERFHPCPGGRHWGPRGAAGILPWTVTSDGRVWVLLSHRSPHVQAGGTWSTFGGAIDDDETPWVAAVREIGEEIDGLDAGSGVVTAELEVPCQHGCGWSYTTFAVRIPNPDPDRLPVAKIASGRSAWETAGLEWIPADQVSERPDLHPGLAAAWPALRDAISG
jgi:8-oxo-dGTP diphosphatase